jgi:hypothetical protein
MTQQSYGSASAIAGLVFQHACGHGDESKEWVLTLVLAEDPEK